MQGGDGTPGQPGTRGRAMDGIRRVLGALFAGIGLYYCALAVWTLVRLPAVTRSWIDRSGDPDFIHDYETFLVLSALGAVAIAALGWLTVVRGVATALGRRVSWLGPALAALPLHWFWFIDRGIGAGALDRQATQRAAAIQFGTVCAGYLLLWFIQSSVDSRRAAPVGPQRATGGESVPGPG